MSNSTLVTAGGASLPSAGDFDLLTPDETARRLKVAKQTLARWRVEGKGPKFVRLNGQGGRIAYRPSDVATWVARYVFASTSEADQAAA
jgi:hypothetical protein